MAWGASLGGQDLPRQGRSVTICGFMATYGSGIGRYVGLNFAPDAVFVAGPASSCSNVKNLAGFWRAAARLDTEAALHADGELSAGGLCRHAAAGGHCFNAYNEQGMEPCRQPVLVAGCRQCRSWASKYRRMANGSW
jgi:hypothetical protein